MAPKIVKFSFQLSANGASVKGSWPYLPLWWLNDCRQKKELSADNLFPIIWSLTFGMCGFLFYLAIASTNWAWEITPSIFWGIACTWELNMRWGQICPCLAIHLTFWTFLQKTIHLTSRNGGSTWEICHKKYHWKLNLNTNSSLVYFL
jgi:hypothetical protein